MYATFETFSLLHILTAFVYKSDYFAVLFYKVI